MTYPPDSPYPWQPTPPGQDLARTDRHPPTPLPPTLMMPATPPAVPVPVVPMPVPMPVPMAVAVPQKSAGAAVALELVLGLFGIFGVGNLYAGRTAAGLLLMLSFWGLFWVNVFLILLFVGFVTMPLTWLAYLVVGPLLAARGVERHNARILAGYPGY